MTTTQTKQAAHGWVPAINTTMSRRRKAASTGPLAPPATFALMELSHLGEIVYDLMCQEVVTLRRGGMSWQEIADALDITRQSAWQRFKHVDPLLNLPHGPDPSKVRRQAERRRHT